MSSGSFGLHVKKRGGVRSIFKVGAEIFLVSPKITAFSIFSRLISQVSVFFAFLLPLKVIMVLGSGGGLNVLVSLFPSLSATSSIVILSLSAVVFYILHIVFDYASTALSKKGLWLVASRARKVVLFPNQEEFSEQVYNRFVSVASRLIYSFAALFVIGFLYWEVAAIMIGWFALVTLSARFAVWTGLVSWEYGDLNFHKMVELSAAVGFMAAFLFVAADYVWFSGPSFIVALVVMILARQLQGQVSGAVNGVYWFVRNGRRAEAVFLHEEVYVPRDHNPNGTLWEIFHGKDNSWLDALWRNATQGDGGSFTWRLVQGGAAGTICLKVVGEDCGKTLLVKLFSRGKGARAAHEEMLTDWLEKPEVAGITAWRRRVKSYECHVWDLKEAALCESVPSRGERQAALVALYSTCPSPSIVSRYTRSKPMLWDRVTALMIDRLKNFATPEEVARLERLKGGLEIAKESLKRMPVFIYPGDVGMNCLLRLSDQSFFSWEWGGWTVEPLGVGFRSREFVDFQRVARIVVERRDECEVSLQASRISAEDLMLASLFYEFDQSFKKERYLDAIGLGERIVDLFESEGMNPAKG